MSLVTNEVLQALLTKLKGVFDTKVDKVSGKGLSTNDFTTEEKEKLAGIAAGATKITVDSALSSSSTNPVQNKVVNAALAGKLDASKKGAAGGVAELDSNGKVPVSQIPGSMDDVVDAYIVSGSTAFSAGWLSLTDGGTALTPESGKIYIIISSGTYNLREYRWSGTAYAEIGKGVTLGETSSTAYRGDRGKIAYDHSQTAHAPANAEANVQSDWNETNTSSDAFIKNKPADMKGATSSKAGTHGFVPAPAAGAQAKYLRGDGTWQTPPNTTYSNMKGATSSAAGAAGLVPAPAAGKQASFLRGDGTWAVPTDTKYSVATQSANGLMSAADKKKLDGMAEMTTTELDTMFTQIFG